MTDTELHSAITAILARRIPDQDAVIACQLEINELLIRWRAEEKPVVVRTIEESEQEGAV